MAKITNSRAKKEGIIQVINVAPKKGKVTRNYDQRISGSVRFGREMKISPKANATVNEPGFSTKFFVPTVSVLIGIGNDHSADLIMTVEAWRAFKSGQPIEITTTEQWKKIAGFIDNKLKSPAKKKK
jgi:hypothetical protein